MKALWFLIGFCFSLSAFAATTVSSQQISEFVKNYPQGATFEKFISQYKNELPGNLAQYFNYKFQKIQSKEMPHVKMISEDSLEIESKGHILILTFLPDRKIKLNGKVLDLMAAKTLEEGWNMIMKAMPNHEHASYLEMFLQKAYADNQESLNGGLMMATGAMAATTSGVAIVAEGASMALLGATGAGLVVMGVSYVFWNNGVCTDISKERFKCVRQKEELEEKIEKDSGAKASMKAKKKPECAGKDQSSFKETSDVLNDLVGANKEMFRAVVTCQKERRDLKGCLEELALMAYHMCGKMYGATDDYLPAYARQGGEAAPMHSTRKQGGK